MNPLQQTVTSETFKISVINFLNFLNDNRVFAIAIASILSEKLSEVITAIIDGVIIPVINRDLDGNGVEDVKQLEEKVFTVLGINFRVGKVFVCLIRFLIVTYIVFILAKILKKWFNNLEKTVVPPTNL